MLRASLLCVGMTLLAVAVLSPRVAPVDAGAGPPPSQATLIISWPGDTNCDSAVDASDALYALQYLVRLIPFDNCLRSADVTCNGVRDARDVLALLRHTAALPVVQPAGCPPIGPQPHYLFGADVSANEANLVQQTVPLASTFFEQSFELSTDAFTFTMDSDLDALAIAYSQNAGITFATARQTLLDEGAVSTPTGIFIYRDHAIWSTAPDDFARQSVIVHQLFHVLQHGMVGLPGLFREPTSQTPYGGPSWMIEGSALWVENVVSYAHPLPPLGCQQLAAAPTLQSIESWAALEAAAQGNRLGSMAVDYLIDQVSLKALGDFWFQIGQGMTWQDAFHDAFDMTIAEYYTAFTAHRVALCP